MRRIMVIGSSGTGKSTLARQMAERLGLPVIHMDVLYWNAGWIETPYSEFRAKVAAAAAGEAWVMDGNYSATWDLRLPRAEAIVWLDLPRRVYFPRVIWRSISNYGRQRADLAPGCPEKLDWYFWWHWVWNYPARSRMKTIGMLERMSATLHCVTLRSPGEVRAFLAALPGSLTRQGAPSPAAS